MSKTKKRFSAWNLLWIVPLLLILALVVLMYVIPAFETVEPTPVDGVANWMTVLSNDLPISDVIIPGTHDSATKDVQLAFFSKCQALTIKEQLVAGFRYLDIRVGFDEKGAKLQHGFCSCTVGSWPWSDPLYLDSVIDDCIDFLKDYPSEFILFAVKHEHGDETDEEVSAAMEAFIAENPEMWLLPDSIPTVGEARGKLVLLRRYGEAAPSEMPGLPLIWANQSGYDDYSLITADELNGSYTLHVQDRYEYPVDEKYMAFVRSLSNETDAENVNLVFLSTKGTAKYGHPYRYAKELNEKLGELSSFNGWIVVDFGSASIAEQIYRCNFVSPGD
ncbi:MAG: hypothetical protein J6P98_04225 [Clostridia bacterium]|nr:hypothetical protein [Clostridia bacterium]